MLGVGVCYSPNCRRALQRAYNPFLQRLLEHPEYFELRGRGRERLHPPELPPLLPPGQSLQRLVRKKSPVQTHSSCKTTYALKKHPTPHQQPDHPSSSVSSKPISGDSCAAKQTSELSR